MNEPTLYKRAISLVHEENPDAVREFGVDYVIDQMTKSDFLDLLSRIGIALVQQVEQGD